MSTASLNQIYEAIGSLKTEVVSLRRDIEESERKQAVATAEAATSRGVLHQRMDAVAQRTAILETNVKGMKDDLTTVKSVTDEVTQWKQAGVGALAVTGIGASAVTALIATYWQDLLKLISRA